MVAQQNLISDAFDSSGVHVLVIGVSYYDHLEGGNNTNQKGMDSKLGQLNGPAKSASNFAAWMQTQHYHPQLNPAGLKSLRVLLSPAEGEDINPNIMQLLENAGEDLRADSNTVSATIAQFQADCENDRDSMVVIYVCGHGVQVISDGAKLLLSDYGSPAKPKLLDASLDLNQFYGGLHGHAYPQTQLWFYDCCAQEPAESKKFEEMTGGIGLDPAIGFADVAPIYMAASEGTSALGKVNENSFFCQSVLWSLEHFGAARIKSPEFENAAENDYIVTTNSINQNLQHILSNIAYMNGNSTQFYRPAGRANPAIFHEYNFTISLPVRIGVSPTDFIHSAREIRNPDGGVVEIANGAWPIEMGLDVGLYVISIQPPGEADSFVVAKAIHPSSVVSDVSRPTTIEHLLEVGL